MTFIAALDELEKGNTVTSKSRNRYMTPVERGENIYVCLYHDPTDFGDEFTIKDFYALDWEVCSLP